MKIAIYPGTFDPITNGHVDVIKRASHIFDEIIVAVANNKNKNPMFSLDKRVELAKLAFEDMPNIKIINFDGLLIDICQKMGIKTIIRGLRAVSDFEFELQIGYANASLDDSINTIYLMPTLQYAFVSSTIVRDILSHNGDVSNLVPTQILDKLQKG